MEKINGPQTLKELEETQRQNVMKIWVALKNGEVLRGEEPDQAYFLHCLELGWVPLTVAPDNKEFTGTDKVHINKDFIEMWGTYKED